ncbi:MAG: ribonuclease HII, partial [Candidatus Hadarchaeales archaeon]
GIDEAGRGPVIGPMMICGVLLKRENIEYLKGLGVRDSKTLTPRKREELAKVIRRISSKYEILRVSPEEIDRARRKEALNELEAEKFALLIDRLGPDEVYIDSVDPNPERFRARLMRHVHHVPAKIVIENFADKKYIPVAAASILAKVERDRTVMMLREKFGDFGSGYPSDPKTIKFLKEWKIRYGKFPDFVRKSWKTLERL